MSSIVLIIQSSMVPALSSFVWLLLAFHVSSSLRIKFAKFFSIASYYVLHCLFCWLSLIVSQLSFVISFLIFRFFSCWLLPAHAIMRFFFKPLPLLPPHPLLAFIVFKTHASNITLSCLSLPIFFNVFEFAQCYACLSFYDLVGRYF